MWCSVSSGQIPMWPTAPPLSRGHTHKEPWLWSLMRSITNTGLVFLYPKVFCGFDKGLPKKTKLLSNPKDDLNLRWSHDWNMPVWLVEPAKLRHGAAAPFRRLEILKYDSTDIVKLMWCISVKLETPRSCVPCNLSRALADVKPTSIYTSTYYALRFPQHLDLQAQVCLKLHFVSKGTSKVDV